MGSYKDITSEGGNGIIPLNFEENVPKYDPSSFYNWEQDNIPLWVLQERGDTLYRQMGSPGGNPEGVTLTLVPTGQQDEAAGKYDNISDIVERIPKRLKFPVLVEICSYGALGTFELANITCEGSGKLEIRNQAYFEDVDASANVDTSCYTGPVTSIALKEVYSLDASSDMLGVSSTRSGEIFGAATSWNNNARIITMQGPDTDRQACNLTVHIASGASLVAGPLNPGETAKGNGQFKLTNYTQDLDHSITTKDANPFWGSSTYSSMLEKREQMLTVGQSTMLGYGNWFSGIKIKDCQGDIIMRNILVDGSNQKSDNVAAGCVHETANGWDIENSEVIMDNNASFRCSSTGFSIKNSRIKATGHWVAWRNYTKTGKLPSTRKSDGTGVFSVNTDILFDSTYYNQSRKYLNWFGKSKRGMELRNSTVRGGIHSTITSALPNGGSSGIGSDATTNMGTALLYCSGSGGDLATTVLNATDCNENGFRLEGTDFEFMGRLNGYLNEGNGMLVNRSQIRLPQFTFNHNSGYGIELNGSQLVYGFGLDEYAEGLGTSFVRVDGYTDCLRGQTNFGAATQANGKRVRNRANFHVAENNQNVLANKSSSIVPYEMNDIPFHFGRWGGADWTPVTIGTANARQTPATHFGASPFRANNLPGIVVTNNSDSELVNVNYAVSSSDTGKGKVAVATNGSNLTFRGTSGCTTTMNYYPITTDTEQFRSWLAAGVVASDNSNLEITGPTKSARFGINFLAEGNSNLRMNPPMKVGTDNILDLSGYRLIDNIGQFGASANHTSVEMLSTRACVVANKQSNLTMYSMGGSVPSDSAGNQAFNSVDVLTTAYADDFLGDQNNQWDRATSGGYVKFYPNAFVSGIGLANGPTFNNANSFDTTKRYLLPEGEHETGTTGGMCVRAVGGSNVDVNLVNFEMYCQPGTLSGAFFNYEGSGCEGMVADVQDDAGSETETPPGPGFTVDSHPPAAGTDSSELIGGGNAGGGYTGENTQNGATEWGKGRIIDDSGTNIVGAKSNDEAQGTLYTAAGEGNNFPATFSDETQVGSTNVIGDGFIDDNGNPAANIKGTNRLGTYYQKPVGGGVSGVNLAADPLCMGTPIHIWNIADTSRIHATNVLVNRLDPETASLGNSDTGANAQNWHGPTGKWWNGASLDYYGLGGRRTTYGALGPAYHNCGIFRLMFSTRGDLKAMYDVSSFSGNNTPAAGWEGTSTSGGSFVDQVNGQGYTHFTQNTRLLDSADTRRITGTDSDMPGGIYELSSCLRVNGWGHPARIPNQGVATMQARMVGFSAVQALSSNPTYDSAYLYTNAAPAMPIPPLHMDWQGYMRNWFDETASNTWQNVKHLAEDKVNGVSIYRSHRGSYGGGEGREGGGGNDGANHSTVSYGAGVRSLNLFDFERLM